MTLARPHIRTVRLSDDEHLDYERARTMLGQSHGAFIRDAILTRVHEVFTNAYSGLEQEHRHDWQTDFTGEFFPRDHAGFAVTYQSCACGAARRIDHSRPHKEIA